MAFAPDGLTWSAAIRETTRRAARSSATVDRHEDDGRFRGRGEVAEGASGLHRQDRRVGFCFGGGIANNLAVRLGRTSPRPCRSTARSRPAADAAKIKAPLLLHYGGPTRGITGGLAGLRRGAEGERT